MSLDLDAAFDKGLLVRPTDTHPNLVHLIRALATLAGVPDLDSADPVRRLTALIGAADHLVFVLLDGLGMNIVHKLPANSFIASHLRLETHATCPSTTACALTAVATGQYPNRHAITGWFTYLPDHGITIATLPFIERMTSEPLTIRGLKVEDVLPLRPLTPLMKHRPLTVVPAPIANTMYNQFTRGGTDGLGYHTITHAVEQIINHVTAARQPTYTHLYLPEIDTLCHKLGVDHPNIVPLVMKIDAELSRLSSTLHDKFADGVRIVISADHGLIDVPKKDQALLLTGDPMLDLLLAPPSGDARMPIFHVRAGQHDAFRNQFTDRFADRMSLAPVEQVEAMQLLGPGRLSDAARPRFGDFIAFPFRPATVAFHPPTKPLGDLYDAVHAGLSPQEMWVPVCVA